MRKDLVEPQVQKLKKNIKIGSCGKQASELVPGLENFLVFALITGTITNTSTT